MPTEYDPDLVSAEDIIKDESMYILHGPGLGYYGKNPAAVALGKLGRAANTEAQKEASRQNGKKGGRPKGSKTKREDDAEPSSPASELEPRRGN